MNTRARRAWIGLGLAIALLPGIGTWADGRWGWIEPAFGAVAHLFFEVPLLAAIRRPGQLALVRAHLALLSVLTSGGCLAAPWLGRHGRACTGVFLLGYALRAGVWIAGGNLPLVPGDSCHYLEVARSVTRGEGPVKHYVESFFRDYPAIREGRGVLDDWATPLFAYVLAGAYTLLRIEPGRSLETTVAVAKGVSFALNLLTLPALYGMARRRYGREVALGAMAVLSVLPVHVLYAGFGLRESLVVLTSILAVWTLTEVWNSGPGPRSRSAWGWAIVAGVAGGLAILARNTALALLAASGLFGLLAHGRRRFGPLMVWGVVLVAVISPWARATWREYGQPFYTYTHFFQYNFSWTVHHYEKGHTQASEFYTGANAPEIVRVKIKSLFIIVGYSTMILGLPIVLGFFRRLVRPDPSGGPKDTDRLIAVILLAFVAATLANIADVTQVAQLGRYYAPVFALMLMPAVAGLRDWSRAAALPRRALPWLATAFVALLWADPTWAYDATWLVKPYQLHWPALQDAGDWIKQHPREVPAEARVMTWFPWELRVVADRTTVLLPRNYSGARIEQVIRQYGVTHVLWGSFEPPPHLDPETWGPYLEQTRKRLELTDARELYRSPPGLPYPVRLYRVR